MTEDGVDEKVEEPTRPVPGAGPAPGHQNPDFDSAIAGWVNDHIRNSPVAWNTLGWNHLMAALKHLPSYLKG